MTVKNRNWFSSRLMLERQRMIPKSVQRFSEKIMRNQQPSGRKDAAREWAR